MLLVQHFDHLHQTVVAGLVDVAEPPDLLRQLRPEEAQQHAIQESCVVVGGGRVCWPCAASDYLVWDNNVGVRPKGVSFSKQGGRAGVGGEMC